MKVKSSFLLKFIMAVLMLGASAGTYAQEATPAPAATASQWSGTWILIISIIAILLFVILLLGGMLIKLVKLVVEKQKNTVATVLLLLISMAAACAQDAPAATAPVATAAKGTDWNLILAGLVLLVEMVVILVFLIQIRSLLNILSGKKQEAAKPITVHLPKILDVFNASVAVEREADIMTDHDYDGIRELDNNLPPWWKYGFYLTIVWAGVYLVYYHVYGAPSSTEAYQTEMEEAAIAKKEFLAKNALNVDENTVTLADASGIAEGKKVFIDNCKACHGEFGEGGVGPNLTDNYWLHGGQLNEIFKSVKYGWTNKGMKSWQSDLTPIQIKNVASFIKSLHGTNPANAKPAQGELVMDSVATAIVDTMMVKPDSAVAKK